MGDGVHDLQLQKKGLALDLVLPGVHQELSDEKVLIWNPASRSTWVTEGTVRPRSNVSNEGWVTWTYAPRLLKFTLVTGKVDNRPTTVYTDREKCITPECCGSASLGQ